MYTAINFKTKKAFKEAVKKYKNGEGPAVTVYQPGGVFPDKKDGNVCIEGPHSPEPHKWYASCTIKDGIVQDVR